MDPALPNLDHSSKPYSLWVKLAAAVILLVFLGVSLYATYRYGKNSISQVPTPNPTATTSATPAVDDVSSWKTYENAKYGFSFKYPADFIVKVDNDVKGQYLLTFSSSGQSLRLDIGQINDGKYSLGSKPSKVVTFGPNKFEYIPSFKYCDAGECGNTNSYYQIANNKYRFDFFSDDQFSSSQTFVQILSSFKFLDQTQSVDTSSWETYNDPKHGFSLQYPTAWSLSSRDTRLDLHGDGSSSLTFYFNDDPDAKVSNFPRSNSNETIKIGIESSVFNNFETTVTRQPAAYSDVKSLVIGKYISLVLFHLDLKTKQSDLSTIKQILATVKFTN